MKTLSPPPPPCHHHHEVRPTNELFQPHDFIHLVVSLMAEDLYIIKLAFRAVLIRGEVYGLKMLLKHQGQQEKSFFLTI
jgi:hypothetical protein